MNLEVTLAFEAANPFDAISMASGLSGFTPDSGCAPELVQSNIYGVRGILTGEVEHPHLIGFVKSKLTKLDPRLRSIVAQREARLTQCPACSKMSLFGGCLRKNCKAQTCKASRFSGGIDRALKYCYDCCKPAGLCQRCGTQFEQPAQATPLPGGHIPPGSTPAPQPPVMGHLPPPRLPRKRGYYVCYTSDPSPAPVKRGMSAKARQRRIDEHKRLTDECADTLRKQYPKLTVAVLAPLIVVVRAKSQRPLSRLPETLGSFKRGPVQQEAEPALPSDFAQP